MEDNAARMLLQLSKIVSNEISTDSGFITRESSPDMVHKNEEAHMREELLQKPKHVYVSDHIFRTVEGVLFLCPFPRALRFINMISMIRLMSLPTGVLSKTTEFR